MSEIARRYYPAAIIAAVGVVIVCLLSGLFEPFQVGLGPEFILKIFAKLLYFAAALVLTRLTIKLVFPTICDYTYTRAGLEKSTFMIDWEKSNGVKTFNPKIYVAVLVHLGVFASVCLLLALAF